MTDNLLFASDTLLFVYGTLRRACPTGAHQRYLAGAEFIANARVQGRLYRVSYYPALVLDHHAGWVQGEIYRLRDTEQLAALDTYEECTYPALPEQEYQRCSARVQLEDGSTVEVWLYAYQRPLADLPVIASGDFLNP